MNPAPSFRHTEHAGLAGLLAVAAILRIAVLILFGSDLQRDPDNYVALARHVRAGDGLVSDVTRAPTAFRPPLYPLLLVPLTALDALWPIAALHVTLSLATVYLTWRTAVQLGLPPLGCWLAGLFVACDPVLLRYLPLPMTETLAAFLSAAMLCLLTRSPLKTVVGSLAWGGLFGLAVLCRPTFWIYGGLLAAWSAWKAIWNWRSSSAEISVSHPAVRLAAGVLAACMVVGPWVVRNRLVLETPIVMTTHGGYTLLLGNNAAFYDEVVQQPRGTVWDGSRGPGQAAWVNGINAEMDRLGLHSEVARDEWMQARAWETIEQRPRDFWQACLLRFRWFWNVGPHAAARGGASEGLVSAVRIGCGVVWVLLGVGLARLGLIALAGRKADNFAFLTGWSAPLVLILAFTAAHLVYWTDARMRAPIIPAVAVVAAWGASWPERHRRKSPSEG